MVSGGKKIRSVPVYLDLLRRAGRSPKTIETYRDSLLQFARFLSVPLEELHQHLEIDNLLAYLDSPRMQSLKPNSRRTALSGITRYMKLNGVEFDELEYQVVRVRRPESREDKPLEYETLARMVDLADTHMKAVLLFWVSTGCRIGETSKLLLSDVRGDVVTVRNEIAKGRRGGKVYLTSEAREMLDLWLRKRDAWVTDADTRARNVGKSRPVNDQRLFGCGHAALSQEFARLYARVDGESVPVRNGNRNMITPHSVRAYFRTHAVKTLPIDMVERLMRHTGYLSDSYVRLTDDQIRAAFHEHEDSLYITRRDRRITDTKMAMFEEKIKVMEQKLALVHLTDPV